jgi:hypothetical protein
MSFLGLGMVICWFVAQNDRSKENFVGANIHRVVDEKALETETWETRGERGKIRGNNNISHHNVEELSRRNVLILLILLLRLLPPPL